MSKKTTEISEMQSVECFATHAMTNVIAPPTLGPRRARIRAGQRKLGWSYNRTKDVFDGDARVTLRGSELVQIEEASGLRYARKELSQVEAYIARAEALLAHQDEDFGRPFLAAMRAFFGALDRS